MSDAIQEVDYGWLLSAALGPMDVFAELLTILPDRFFRLDQGARQPYFHAMLRAYNHGERDLHELARASGLEVGGGS